jgi:cytochrome b
MLNASAMNDGQTATRIRVWDIPVRLFHWSLVLLIIALFVTGKLGGNWLEWHKRAGFSVLGLVTFRILWGFVGSHHARFVNFVRGPRAVATYLKALAQKNSVPHAGHNPLGAISVVTMLGVLLLQGILGLFSNDDIMLEGPYASMVSKALSDQLTMLHKLNSNLILILIAVHLAAIAFAYFYKKENLVKAMITGEKLLPANSSAAAPARPAWLAWVIGAVVAIATYGLLNK